MNQSHGDDVEVHGNSMKKMKNNLCLVSMTQMLLAKLWVLFTAIDNDRCCWFSSHHIILPLFHLPLDISAHSFSANSQLPQEVFSFFLKVYTAAVFSYATELNLSSDLYWKIIFRLSILLLFFISLSSTQSLYYYWNRPCTRVNNGMIRWANEWHDSTSENAGWRGSDSD